MTYDEWYQQVDKQLINLVGLDQMDLPDWLSMDAYSDGATPEQGAIMCLESAGIDYEKLIDEG